MDTTNMRIQLTPPLLYARGSLWSTRYSAPAGCAASACPTGFLQHLLLNGSKGIGLPGLPLGPVSEAATAAALHDVWAGGSSRLVQPSSTSAAAAGLRFDKCSLASGRIHRPVAPLEPLLRRIFRHANSARLAHGLQGELSRYDLFHGHLFSARLDGLAVLGILMHAYEYPAQDAHILGGVTLGYCQEGSDCRPRLREWRFRNLLWSCWWPSGQQTAPGGEQTTVEETPAPTRVRGGAPGMRPEQGTWLLDGTAPAVAALRVDGTPFGPDCPNAVWEG